MHLLVDADSLWVGSQGYLMHGQDKYWHRTVMENLLGRELVGEECVHHIDRNKLNNEPNNLLLCKDNAEHRQVHAREDTQRAGFDPDLFKWCSGHQQYESKIHFSFASTGDGLHSSCKEYTNTYRKLKGYKTPWTEERKLQQQLRRKAAKCIC